ncbi:hypothetical protein AX16_001975 [Volvariella volvacea WC 439]|nr:hypothetical protein AX16_001975 [Volvariella volvacea WC 439]
MANVGSRVSSQKPSHSKFIIQSSDVLQDTRINVLEEDSKTIIWHKERLLIEDEIIENVVHTPTNTICWSIHKPARGWYIRLRSPLFPPGTFIPLTPVPQSSLHYVEGSLSFIMRTNVTTEEPPSVSRQSSLTTIHSYPPTPPLSITIEPPSPPSLHAKLESISSRLSKRQTLPSSQATRFVLSPTSYQRVQPASNSFLSRAWAAIRNNRPSNSNSFTLSRIPESKVIQPPPPYTSTAESPISAPLPAPTPLPAPPPTLIFHDQTPTFTAYAITGLLEIDKGEEQFLGVDTAFWVTIALAYLEFLEDRESYFAALYD